MPNIILTWSVNCVIFNSTNATTFAITDTTIYDLEVNLSTQDKSKLLQHLKSKLKQM